MVSLDWKQINHTTMNTTDLTTGPTSEPQKSATAKPATKPETGKRRSTGPSSSNIEASPVNAAWAAEAVKTFGITGPFGDAVAADLTKSVAALIAKATTREKLTKLIKAAINLNVGKVGSSE